MRKSSSVKVSATKSRSKSPLRDKYIGISPQHLKHLLNEVKNQSVLLWNYKGLKILPKSLIQEASHVQQIYLKHNLLVELPDNLGCLRNLTFLYLYGNNIEDLPDSIGDIKTLNILDLSNNKLKVLRRPMMELINLRSLVISNNELSNIPSEICNLKALSILILTGNRLRSLPETIGELRALQGLYLDNNFLQHLPHSIVNLPLLAHLSCCHNYLLSLPSRPFLSQPALFFDNNPDLNYIPFCLLEHLKIGDFYEPFLLPSYGCFSRNPICNKLVKISYNEIFPESDVIHLPFQLANISCVKDFSKLNVPPLLEICLRSLWNEKSRINLNDIILPGFLPSNLSTILSMGPVIHCDNCNISIIIAFATLIIISVNITSQQGIEGQEIPVAIYFCDDSCFKSFLLKLRASTDLYNQWLYRSLNSRLGIEIVS